MGMQSIIICSDLHYSGIGKAVFTKLIGGLLPKSDEKASERYAIVIPVKFITYSVSLALLLFPVCMLMLD